MSYHILVSHGERDWEFDVLEWQSIVKQLCVTGARVIVIANNAPEGSNKIVLDTNDAPKGWAFA